MRNPGPQAPPLRLPLLYLIGASAWLLGGTWLLLRLTPGLPPFARWSLLLDAAFIAVSAALLALLLRRSHERNAGTESHLAALVRSAMDAIVCVDDRQRIVLFNPAAERMFGCAAAEALGQPLARFLPPGAAAAHRGHVRRFMETGASARRGGHLGTLTAVRADGSPFPAEISIATVTAGGQLLATAIVRDVSERARHERERDELLLRTEALNEETGRRLRRLAALRAIDQAMIGGGELALTLDRILAELVAQLGADVGMVLLLEGPGPELRLVAQRGLRTSAGRQLRVRVGEGLAGRAALTRERAAYDGGGAGVTPQLAAMVADEGLAQGYGVPLLIEGAVIGVLDVFFRARRAVDAEWLDFLDALAGQAALAIHRATLVAQLEGANRELSEAYDSTLEGWARALELRDKETEGHCQRVTALTVRLARALGEPEEQLVHIRRGALLHDIGKMGVPDAILRKPGALTPEERLEIERHPVYAHMWLAPIAFLQPALDIPRYHHERWDGAGYPAGLRGEAIPRPARIFAVVDVWDALTSDRPYRAAWPPERARAYLGAQAGLQFDPEVVAAFLALDAPKP